MRFHSFVFLFLLTGVLFSPCFAQGMDKVKLEKQTNDPYLWDFGVISESDSPSHDFTIKNNSNKTLVIKEVTSSCGCTVSQAKKKELRPQESTEIEVSFKAKGYSGAVTQYVYVSTNDVNNPVIKLTIKAEVVK